jgi:alpha-N-acetylglucosaminidase
MGKIIQKFIIASVLITSCILRTMTCEAQAARDVLSRIIGKGQSSRFVFELDTASPNSFSVDVRNNKVFITASDQVALCRGAYQYLSSKCSTIVNWSGTRASLPKQLPAYTNTVKISYPYHFYFNVVSHAYSTAYWDWARWEKEIDWMAVHGINMPLLPGAFEAIIARVFLKLGFSKQEINEFFTGPAYLPFNKMGCITGWDGPVPESFFEKQLKLNHKILARMKELDMHPIIPAFAGFVPAAIKTRFEREPVRQVKWGGFEDKYQAYLLEPGSDLFVEIGTMFITEYEKEFGKQEFYIADSFNELDVPLSADSLTMLKELAGYGEAVYKSIRNGNPDAIWVMQGWTFPYYQKDGKLFWTPDKLSALISHVPDNKLIILDLANEYNRLWWKIDPSWKMYSGFFGKQWIYSFIPNMGGKTAYNGRLDLYASMFTEARDYSQKGNLIGFGFAPEGVENNEIIYELLSDVGWTDEKIDLNSWISKFCVNRYGGYPDNMKKAFQYFNTSCFGTFTDHPRNAYQFRPDSKQYGSVNRSDDFGKGVELFLSCRDQLKNSELYVVDAIEYTVQYLGIEADKLLESFQKGDGKDRDQFEQAMAILAGMDKL